MTTYLGRFLILAKLAGEWSAANPVLMNGELGVADPGSATPVLKVGDGVRTWSALPPIMGGSGSSGSPDYIVGTTTTLAPGSFATVTINNAASPPTISFGIPQGAAGPANSLAIGTVTTGAPGSAAAALITGTPPAQTLNLVIPQGPVGPAGAAGADGASGPTGAGGPAGPANSLAIGTVTTGAAGSAAAATITGTPPTQTLNLTIPTGAQGPAGGGNFAIPTTLVGLVAVDGVSNNSIRSDAAPALSQAIAPVWTAQHQFTSAGASGAVRMVSASPSIVWQESDAAADTQMWRGRVDGNALTFAVCNDAFSTESPFLTVLRTVDAVSLIRFGNNVANPAFNFQGSGAITAGGSLVMGSATGGSMGAGTVNAQGLYVNGVAVPSALSANNPTASVGLTAVNGSAVTFMRSDAAPQLDQSIAPTWTGAHTFTNVLKLRESADPGIAAADEYWITARDDSGITRAMVSNSRAQWVINQDNYVVGRNVSGATIAKLRAVRALGGSANRPTIGLADSSLNQQAGGITAAAVANNGFVEVMTVGVITNVDTSAWTAGTRLYLGSAGVLTSTPPAYPATLQLLGVVLDSHAINGSVYVSRTSDVRSGLTAGDAFANPSASIGLTAVNGSALTVMRSDAAPALSQTIAPTWTGQHVYSSTFASGAVRLSSASPALVWTESDQPTDTQNWRMRVNGAGFTFAVLNDALSTESAIMIALRTVAAVTQIRFGNTTDNPTYSFLGTGAVTSGGPFRAPDGTLAAPSHTFASDLGSGLMRGSNNYLRIVCGGAPIADFLGAGASSVPRLLMGAGIVFAAQPGSATNPSIAFEGDLDTGALNDSPDSIAFTAGGTTRVLVRSAGLIIGSGQVFLQDGSAANPALTFLGGGQNSGISRDGSNGLAFSTGGAQRVNIGPTGSVISAVPDGTVSMEMQAASGKLRFYGFSTASAYIQAMNLAASAFIPLDIGASTTTFSVGGVVAPSFTVSSSRAIKRETGAPAGARGILARLRPILYRLLAGDEREQLGLIAEEVHEVCPLLSDGKTVSYDRLALLLLADWQEQHAGEMR
jgi:hypothetical protein